MKDELAWWFVFIILVVAGLSYGVVAIMALLQAFK